MKRFVLIFTSILMLCLCVTLWASCDTADTPGDTVAATQPATEAEATVAETTAPEDTQAATSAEETTVEDMTVVTEVPTETPTEAATEAATEAETEIPVAGMDSGIVRDGTPKKYFTIRFDDGITQDARVMETLKKYGADCCTFYINTGLGGANWAWVGQQYNRPDIPHLRYTKRELKSGIYDGFDVEVHTLNHPSLKNLTDAEVTTEVKRDAQNITRIIGTQPVGMAWPGGDTEWNENNITTILARTDIRYGSCTTRNTVMGLDKFSLPDYFMTWYPTCNFSDLDCMALLDEFLAAEPTEDMLFFVWSHGYELDLYYSWDRFDQLIKTVTEAAAQDDSLVLVTNAEFYQLFKDEIPSWQ